MSNWAKDISGFVVHDLSLETPIQEQHGDTTPVDRFFVCNSGTTPRLSKTDYELRICGDGVARELTLSYADLEAMPQLTVPALLECAGNHRSLFELVMGEKLDKRPHMKELKWGLGAIGMAEWQGVPLRLVLEQAGIRDGAYHVCPVGGESDSLEGTVQIPMPVAKAIDNDTILALRMNGEDLRPDHGFPVRVIVPGWVGAYSVKWVRQIEVSTQHLWVRRNTETYVLMGDAWPAERYAPAQGAPITEHPIRCSLTLPWPARLAPGDHVLHGIARAPATPIGQVLWSDDAGATWHDCDLVGPNRKYGWARFKFDWRAEPGERAIMTRAIDTQGNAQPLTIPFNNGGYLYNAVHPHPVTVV